MSYLQKKNENKILLMNYEKGQIYNRTYSTTLLNDKASSSYEMMIILIAH